MAENKVEIQTIRIVHHGAELNIQVGPYGDCTCGGEVLGLVNPFAFQLLMEGLTHALEKPNERMLPVEGEEGKFRRHDKCECGHYSSDHTATGCLREARPGWRCKCKGYNGP